MDDLKCWEIVDRVHALSGGDMDEKCETLTAMLSSLNREDAIAFSLFFDAMMDRAYSWPLWGAAYVIHGGCGDDSFSDFRAALISRGRRAYEKALADPDSLAEDDDFDDEAWFYEGYQYAASDGIRIAAGSDVKRARSAPSTPSGTEWAEDDVNNLYPKLAEKFG